MEHHSCLFLALLLLLAMHNSDPGLDNVEPALLADDSAVLFTAAEI